MSSPIAIGRAQEHSRCLARSISPFLGGGVRVRDSSWTASPLPPTTSPSSGGVRCVEKFSLRFQLILNRLTVK